MEATITLDDLLQRLERMGLIAILSPLDVEYAVEQLTGLSPDQLTVCDAERIKFMTGFEA